MAMERTTIMAPASLIKRISEHVEKRGDKMSTFCTRAILNQLETEGDFEIRDIVEDEINANREEAAKT